MSRRGKTLLRHGSEVFLVLMTIVALLCCLYFLHAYKEQKNRLDPEEMETADLKAEEEGDCSEMTYYILNAEDQALLRKYQDYNSDIVGIVRIEGTVLNHPVCQTKEDEEYYLTHDLDGNYNSHGVPFLSAESEMETEAGNMVIYGHNIHKISRDVFCDLAGYEDLTYYKEHPYIETVSESGTRRWLIFAYFIQDNSDPDAFRYSDYTQFRSKKELEEFLNGVQERNWINVDVTVGMDDALITLSSCSNELSGKGTNRMVVIGKLLPVGDQAGDIIASATMSESPLLPDALE